MASLSKRNATLRLLIWCLCYVPLIWYLITRAAGSFWPRFIWGGLIQSAALGFAAGFVLNRWYGGIYGLMIASVGIMAVPAAYPFDDRFGEPQHLDLDTRFLIGLCVCAALGVPIGWILVSVRKFFLRNAA